ncbi:cytochrome P450 [Rhizodiscina lignyota]|uniref:Cytochrome P450 n=1 Tax=Rhizodiscina lignyota TaxID=1504668 RepID=A0A9P4I386_9PEZI|nr:cytochrome P450 [Rhizodiscina lignyota]
MPTSTIAERRPKYRTSCDSCQAAKVGCSHDKPSCRRCSIQKLECVYSPSRRKGRPRAKAQTAEDAARGESNAGPNSRLRSTAATPASNSGTSGVTNDAALGVIAREPPLPEPIRLSDPWTPGGAFDAPNAGGTMDESSMPSTVTSLDFYSATTPMGLDEAFGFPVMPFALEDSSGPTDAALIENYDPGALLSAKMLAVNDSTPFSLLDSQSSTQKRHSNNEFAQYLAQEPDRPARAESMSGLDSVSSFNQMFDDTSDIVPGMGNVLQDAHSSAFFSTARRGDGGDEIVSSEEESWSLCDVRPLAKRRRSSCNCVSAILQRIQSVKAGKQNKGPISIDCALVMENEVRECLSRLQRCKSCSQDSTSHLLALISVRMMLSLLRTTVDDEFMSRPRRKSVASSDGQLSTSKGDRSNLYIGNFKVPSKARYRFLRGALQARFSRLLLLIEEREKLVNGVGRDCFAKSASVLLGDISQDLRTITGCLKPVPGQLRVRILKFLSFVQSFTVSLGRLGLSFAMSTSLADRAVFISQSLRIRPLASGALVVLSLVLIILYLDYLNYHKQRKRLGDVPILGDESYIRRRLRLTSAQVNLRKVLQRGYDTFTKNSKIWAFRGQHDDYVLIMPPGTPEEVKNIGADRLSFLQAVEESYHFRLHTNILYRSHVDAVRQSVNKNLSNEPRAAFLTIWHLTHLVAASFLIGPEFSRKAEYIKAIETYCLVVPLFVHVYFRVPAPLRRIFWYLSPQGFSIRACIKKLKAFIVPEVRRTVDAWKKGERAREQFTLLGAILEVKVERGQLKREMSKAEEERQIDIFSDEVIFTGFDSAGPVACLVTQLLYESIQHEHIVEPLRNEVRAALTSSDGEWSDQAMSSLPRLESFTRETLRVDGPTLFSVTRSVLQPMQLKCGMELRPGHIITSPAWLVHNDEDIYPKAHEFNPYRFYDEKTNTATTKATTASEKFLGYGYGSQICPGRHLGIRMSQMLFAKMLMRYDAEFEDKQRGKPENDIMPGQVLPPYEAKMILRTRAKGDREKA